MTHIAGIGVAWYRKADYEQLKTIFEDAHLLPETFEQWEELAQNGRKHFMSEGYVVVQAYIDPRTFPAWCRERGLNIDAKARMQFATMESHRVTSNIKKD